MAWELERRTFAAVRRHGSSGLVLALGATILLLLVAPRVEAGAVRGRMAVASESAIAAREALDQMKRGGNAVDAAVTAALVGGVTNPTSSGIGGGGFALVWLAVDHRPYLLDFRESAPQGLDADAFERRPLPDAERAQLTGVPGEVRGLWELHRKLGKRTWHEVVRPAVRVARSGYPVGQHLGSMLRQYRGRLPPDEGLRRTFYPGGRPAAVGTVVRNPDLARTLERIEVEGPSALYEGPVAARVVGAAARAGGSLTLADLGGYRPVERKPLRVKWEGYEIYTMPPPSAGGIMLAQTLAMYSGRELKRLGPESGAYQHLLAEAMRGAIADRMRYLGDPDHQTVDVARLLDPKRLARRRASIGLDRTHALPRFGLEESGTHHLVTADGGGNFVSLTTTINRVFGAKLTADDTGVVLNDELDDFTSANQVAPFGMRRSPNRARPGARPVSSMSPTIVVREGRVVLALGGSGGTAIATNVTQATLSRLVFDMAPRDVVAAPRFYVPDAHATIWLEKGARAELVEDLEGRGEIVATTPFSKSAIQLIAVDQGFKVPAADPRKHGAALAR